jgi:hypothetical protein
MTKRSLPPLKKCPVSVPLAWEEKILERTLQLNVSKAEYIRELVRRDLNIEKVHTSRAPTGLGGLSYPIEFDVPAYIEDNLKRTALAHKVTLSSVVLAIMHKHIPNLSTQTFTPKKYNKDLWVRRGVSDTCRIKVSVPNTWHDDVDAYASGRTHGKAVKDLVTAVIDGRDVMGE